MLPYYIIFGFIFLIALIPSKSKDVRLLSCIVMFVVLSVIMGLRNEYYAGVDTHVYVNDFNRIVDKKLSFGQIADEFYKDYLYYYASKIFSIVCPDANMWLLFCAAFYIGTVSWFIYKYSNSVWLSYLIFVGWDMYAYNFQIVRHTWSLAFVLLSFPFLLRRDIKKYALVMLMAITSQIVSLVSVVSYWIARLKPKMTVVVLPVIIGLLIFIIMMQRDTLISFLFSFDFLRDSDRFSSFSEIEGGKLVNFAISTVFILLSYYEIFRNAKYIKKGKDRQLIFSLLNISAVGIIFFAFQFVIYEFYRVAQYFSIFNIVLVPQVLRLEKNVLIRIILTLGIAVCLTKHFFGGIIDSYEYDPYLFYWE